MDSRTAHVITKREPSSQQQLMFQVSARVCGPFPRKKMLQHVALLALMAAVVMGPVNGSDEWEMLGCFHKGGQKVAIVGSFCFVFCFVLLFAERPSKGRDYVVTSAVGVSAKVVIQDLSVQYAIVCISQWNLIFFFLFLWFLADRQTARSGGTSRPCASRALTADSAMMTAPPSCPCAKSNKDPHVMCHGRRDRLPRSRTASGLRIACDSSAVASATLAAPPPSARVCAFTSRSPPVTSTVSYKIISWRQLL